MGKTVLDLLLKLCHFSSMNMKLTSKTICTLLALVMLLSPVQVFARALFLNSSIINASTLNSANHAGYLEAEVSSPTLASRQAIPENCHEDMQTLTDSGMPEQAEASSVQSDMLSDMAHSKHTKSVDSSDCCIQDCSCSDSVCHSFSLVFSPNTLSYTHFSQQYDFNLSFYISLASGPASPPPIV